ncbi:MAG: HI0074 family nucleotidyltransferase substrate-binding subunit [Verrucomicrobiota bacterium]|nr:HI0074 family nucleotidyltransferase substrate-binding subunit [Verrucomicrobiota bacterium]
MALELESLKKAIGALERSLRVAEEQAGAGDIDLLETLRAGVVQNFEVAYEQTWKMMKRWLEVNTSPVDVDGVTRRQLFRLCHENRLIDDVEDWMNFHKSRNETSHTYNAATAKDVFKVAGEFLPAASDVFSRIASRND